MGSTPNLVHQCDKTCVICGGTDRLQVPHRIALADGGTNQLSNLELRCETHHKHVPAKSRSSTPPHREAQEQRIAVSLNADGMDV
jgi:hypothetical protein